VAEAKTYPWALGKVAENHWLLQIQGMEVRFEGSNAEAMAGRVNYCLQIAYDLGGKNAFNRLRQLIGVGAIRAE
jgi:hypothetical protein